MSIKGRNSFLSFAGATLVVQSLVSEKNQNPFELKFSSFLLTEKKTALLTKSDIILKCLQQLQMYNFFSSSRCLKKIKIFNFFPPGLIGNILHYSSFFFIIKNSTILKQKNFFALTWKQRHVTTFDIFSFKVKQIVVGPLLIGHFLDSGKPLPPVRFLQTDRLY